MFESSALAGDQRRNPRRWRTSSARLTRLDSIRGRQRKRQSRYGPESALSLKLQCRQRRKRCSHGCQRPTHFILNYGVKTVHIAAPGKASSAHGSKTGSVKRRERRWRRRWLPGCGVDSRRTQDMSVDELRQHLLKSVDKLGSLKGKWRPAAGSTPQGCGAQ